MIGVGGYSSGPTLLMASLRRIPTMVVEPNAMPGFTNRVLARFVKAAALSFEEAEVFRGARGGDRQPDSLRLRASYQEGARRQTECADIWRQPGGPRHQSGDDRGAAVACFKKEQLAITHQTGEADFEVSRRAYAEAGFDDADVQPFIHDMAEQFARADVLICRSGATTAAEVAAAGKAAIFIPFPFATDDHQRKNAEAFERGGRTNDRAEGSNARATGPGTDSTD